ncbi:MAG TPA: nuclear transport factor 2 family protein [Mycobacterium sp.]
MHPFQAAVQAHDIAALEAFLADDVVFTSPNTFKPYPGKAITAAFLRAVLRVLDDFHYVRQIADSGGRDHAFIFQARIGDRQISGCDFVHWDADGKIDEFTVMVRPLSAANALQEAMGAQMERIKREALEQRRCN